MKNSKLKSLLKLLDDEDHKVANFAMAELLAMEGADKILPRLQESRRTGIRARSHQMQAVLRMRRLRSRIRSRLGSQSRSLVHSLIDLHMLWYDDDSRTEVCRLWRQFLLTSSEWKIDSLRSLVDFMKDCGFSVPTVDEVFADYYCIASVLEERTGADFMLCAVACQTAAEHGLQLRIVNTDTGFGLMDASGRISLPAADWGIFKEIPEMHAVACDAAMICRTAASMLLLAAMVTESFRYVHTIGECLVHKSSGKNVFDVLPYPFGRNGLEPKHPTLNFRHSPQ